MFQHLGYHISFEDIPPGYVWYYGAKAKSRSSYLTAKKHRESSAKSIYLSLLRERLKVKPVPREIVSQLAYTSAMTKHHLADLINEVLEQLVKDSYELPCFDVLARVAADQRRAANSFLYKQCSQAFNETSRQLLLSSSGWEKLKADPRKPTTKNTSETLKHLKWLRHQQSLLPKLPEIAPEKYRAFQMEAYALDHSEMARMREGKQGLLLSILLRYRLSRTLDDAANLFIKTMRRMHTKAHQKMEDWLSKKTKQQEQLIRQLKDVTLAYQGSNKNDQRKLQSIGTALKHNPQEVINSCNELLVYSG